jgi:spore coat-associated protein N
MEPEVPEQIVPLVTTAREHREYGEAERKGNQAMRKPAALLAGMALSALVLIGLTVTADKSSASFTATTTNPANSFGSATLSASNDKSAAASLISISNLVPGDTANRTVVITNSGNAGFTYVGAASATASTALWTDTTNGLQVTVKRGATVLYTGALKDLAIPASGTIAAAAIDTLTFDFSLPTSADNTFQTLTQDFTITYTATQLAGAAR